MGKKYNIAQFGAFDVNSFGDSMFPVAAERELGKRVQIGEFVLFSPVGTEDAYNANGKIYAYDDFEELHGRIGFDLILIGGGELFHFKRIEFDSRDSGRTEYGPGYIWREPVKYARKHKINYLFCGIGVPYAFEGSERAEVCDAIEHALYAGARDVYSLQRLADAVEQTEMLYLQPDGLWLLDAYFDKEELEGIRSRLRRQKGSFARQNYMVVQYGTTYQYQIVAGELKRAAEENGWKIVLMPVNYCHEDLYALRMIYEELQGEADFYDKLLQPIEIAALISGASFFVGTSLHGNLAAAVYGVKSLAFDMYGTFVSKMDGLLQWKKEEQHITVLPDCIAGDIKRILMEPDQRHRVSEIQQAMKAGYDRIACKIQGRKEAAESPSGVCEVLPADRKCYFSVCPADGAKYSYVSIAQLAGNTLTFEVHLPKGLPLREIKAYLPLQEACELSVAECRCGEEEISYESINLLNPEGICLYKMAQIRLVCCKGGDFRITFALGAEDKAKLAECYFEQYNNLADDLVRKELQLQRMSEGLEQKRAAIRNQEAHIEQLMQSERDLQAQLELMKNSRTWRFAVLLHKPVELLLPVGSRRRLFAKMFARLLRHPLRSVRMLSPMKIRHFLTFLKEEGPEFVSNRMDQSMLGTSIQKLDLELTERREELPFEEYQPLYFNPEENPLVSIVIPVYNQFSYTYHCLQSILKNTGGSVSYEVIVANDCSTDDTIRLHEIVDNVRIVTNEENLRFLKNCNHAAEYARGEYILFLNNDTQVQKNWLRPLVELMENDAGIGMTGSKLVYANGTLQEAGGILWKDASAWNYGNGSDPANPEFNYVKDVDYISGASILIRTSLWKEIGGFDERFAPAYCEDSDLAFEVRKHGYRVVYQPASVVVHFEGVSNGTDVSSGIKQYQVKNNHKLKEKWAEEFARQDPNGENVFRARERSQGKKIIVFLDHYVPHFDEDAGSKTIYQYLKMFIQKGYIVKFIGDNFYKHEPYTTVLQQMGIEVLYGSYYAAHIQDWIRKNKNQIDFFFLNRPHIAIKYIDTICNDTEIRTIYYGHDLHFLRNRREYELTGDVKKKKESEEWLKKEMYLMKKADISYYPSVIEEEEIHKIDPQIAVKAITAYVYDQFREDLEYDFSKREGILFVGGFTHDPNADAVLWFVNEIWPSIYGKTGAPFYIVGSHATQKIQMLDGREGVVFKGFVSDEELEALYARCKITVVPLRYGAGVKGKVVEALYNGMPIVTTSVGAEGIAGIETAAVIEDDPVKFAEQVVSLYRDHEKLRAIAVQTQKLIRAQFSTEAVWEIIQEDFDYEGE